jgi:hypothetical protein
MLAPLGTCTLLLTRPHCIKKAQCLFRHTTIRLSWENGHARSTGTVKQASFESSAGKNHTSALHDCNLAILQRTWAMFGMRSMAWLAKQASCVMPYNANDQHIQAQTGHWMRHPICVHCL